MTATLRRLLVKRTLIQHHKKIYHTRAKITKRTQLNHSSIDLHIEMASKSISFKIYIIDDDDNHRLAASVDRAKLAFFSDLAVALPQVAPDPSRPEKHSMTLAKGVADGKALARISTWIETNSIKDPQQLTLAGKSMLHRLHSRTHR